METPLWNDERERPLQHIRIIDFSVMLPGPYLTRILAQYGAEVIKVENTPLGDYTRQVEGTDLFDLMNRGKRSLAMDFSSPQFAPIIKQLVGEADIFVEGFRQGVMEEMGLGYAELSEENPDLIYLSLRGFGGELANTSGHDLNFIARSGCGEWFLESGHPNYSTQYADLVGGTFIPAIKLLMHLSNPARGGMHLVTSMEESFRALYLHRAFDAANDRTHQTSRPWVLTGNQPHSRYYRCRDNHWISLNAIQKKHWETFCDVVDRAQWKERQHDASLISEVETLFQDAPSSYWEAISQNREMCLIRVIPWEEHLNFTNTQQTLADDPLTWCGFAPNLALKPCPKLGEDTFSVLSASGMSNKEIARWIEQKVIYQPNEH